MFPQYIVLFSLGWPPVAGAGSRRSVPRLQRRLGLAGAAAAARVSAVLWAGGFFDGGAAEDRFAGGLHWQAAAGALLEGTIATCISLWTVAHFRRHEGRYRPTARPADGPVRLRRVHRPPDRNLAGSRSVHRCRCRQS